MFEDVFRSSRFSVIEIGKKRQELDQEHFGYGQVPRGWLPELPEDPKIQKQLKKRKITLISVAVRK